MLRNISFVVFMILKLVNSTESYNSPPRGSSAWGYFAPPLLQRAPQPHQTPMEAMVDLTNELAVSILQDHSFSRGNFAFSPYGVASVLVVLYEGARGESARQIHRAIGFPSNKDVIRVGFRDIHRHLRSYFSHEGYLSGISLNREGSSLRPEYKKVLRFYGYDVEMNHSFNDENDLESTTVAETIKPTVGAFFVSPVSGFDKTHEVTTTERVIHTESIRDETTTAAVVEENGELNETTTSLSTTEFQIDLTVENNSNCSLLNNGSTVCETVEEKESEMLLSTTEHLDNDTETTTGDFEETTKILDNGMLIPQDDIETVTERNSTTEESTTTEMTSEIPTEMTSEIPIEMTSEIPTETASILPIETTTLPLEMTTVGLNKPKQNAVTQLSSKNEIKISKNVSEIEEQRVNNIRSMFSRRSQTWLTGTPRRTKFRRARTITDYLKVPQNTELSLQLQNGMYDTHISRNANLYRSLPKHLFLVDGAIDTPVPMMKYTNVFSYAYLPRLHSKAMEFPLDDERYKLLILLPVERRGLRQLIYDLTGYPLNEILKALRPQKVKAMVPTFMVEGFVILTSSLQKLGIWDVFDPRKANLSGMSMDPELYVRNVEQSVTVVIRNYVEILDIQTRTMAARHMEQEFEATHPFLYFVMDTATNVALMAGQILDPLNSRIY